MLVYPIECLYAHINVIVGFSDVRGRELEHSLQDIS